MPWNTLHRVYAGWCWRLRLFSCTCPSPSLPPQPSHGELYCSHPETVSDSCYSSPGRGVLQSLFSHHFPWGPSNARCIASSALAAVFCRVETTTSSMDKSWWCDQGLLGWRWKQERRGSGVLQTPLTSGAQSYTRYIFLFSSLLHSYSTLPKCFPVLLVTQPVSLLVQTLLLLFLPLLPWRTRHLFLPWRGNGCPPSQRMHHSHVSARDCVWAAAWPERRKKLWLNN